MPNEQVKSVQRLFFALWPDEQVVKKIKQHAIKHFSSCHGKAVHKQNWHITLAYFGNADPDTRHCLEKQAATVTAQPFEIELGQLGFWKRPKVAWLGPEEIPETLKQLAFDIQHAIELCGYEPETREYHPHCTLVKKAKQSPSSSEIQPIHWQVDSFSLVESKTHQQGAEYTILKSWGLS